MKRTTQKTTYNILFCGKAKHTQEQIKLCVLSNSTTPIMCLIKNQSNTCYHHHNVKKGGDCPVERSVFITDTDDEYGRDEQEEEGRGQQKDGSGSNIKTTIKPANIKWPWWSAVHGEKGRGIVVVVFSCIHSYVFCFVLLFFFNFILCVVVVCFFFLYIGKVMNSF